MQKNALTKETGKTSRRPLYDSPWLALFELLRRELSRVGSPTLNRDDRLSHRP